MFGTVRKAEDIMARVDILGIQVDPVTMTDAVTRIADAVRERMPLRVVTANPEMIYAALKDARLRQVINSADLVTPDGVGVVWAADQLGTPVPERVTGIDLLAVLWPVAARGQWRVYFLGSRPGVAEAAATQVAGAHPGIVWAARDGYFKAAEEENVVKEIRVFNPDLLLVGLGAPRQEYWLAGHPGLATVGIGVGGSFDALAGLVTRAPQRVRDLRLEWLYRLCQEPWRWRRQTVLPRFAARVLAKKWGM